MWGLGFGLPYAGTRVDETAIAGPAVHFLSSDLRPPDFMYPTGFLYAVASVYAGWYAITSPFGVYSSLEAFADRRYQTVAPFFYLSRSLSALMGTLTVWWIFSICRRVFDDCAGIVAALFAALAFLHVRDSHFGTIDVSMAALVVLSLLAIVRWRETADPWRAAVAGLIAGVATSTKYNALGVCVPFVLAVAQRTFWEGPSKRIGLKRALLMMAIFGATFALGFFGSSPYILVEWQRFVRDVAAQTTTLAQGHGLRLSRGWWHHASITLPAALGWPLYLAGVGGALLLLLTRLRQAAVVLAFPLAYYVVSGSGYRVFARDMIPIIPFLCITAAWLTVAAVRAVIAPTRSTARSWATALVAFALVALSARNVVLLDRLLTRADNRVVVAKALPALIPAGSLVYHSGETYGRVPFYLSDPPLNVVLCDYDDATSQFTSDGRLPTWIILQRSPLVLYSRVPQGVERLVHERYELVRSFQTTATNKTRVYDQQDALFLPLADLSDIDRIGPSFEIYRVRRTE